VTRACVWLGASAQPNHCGLRSQGVLEHLFCGLYIGWFPGGTRDRREERTAPDMDASSDPASCGAVRQQLCIEGRMFMTVEATSFVRVGRKVTGIRVTGADLYSNPQVCVCARARARGCLYVSVCLSACVLRPRSSLSLSVSLLPSCSLALFLSRSRSCSRSLSDYRPGFYTHVCRQR